MNNPDVYESESVKRALEGKANIDIMSAFKQGNELTKNSFGVFTLAGAIVFTVVIATVFVLLSFFGIPLEEFNNADPTKRAIMDILLVLIMSPLMAGLMMMGINRARQNSIQVFDLFNWFSIAIVLALGSLITSIMIQLSMSIFILIGVYLGIATTFTLPLIADKRLTAVSAIILSVRVVNKYLLQFVLFFVLSMLLFFAAAFTLGLGLIWALPLYFNTKGILFEELFGHAENVPQTHDESNSVDNGTTSTFDA